MLKKITDHSECVCDPDVWLDAEYDGSLRHSIIQKFSCIVINFSGVVLNHQQRSHGYGDAPSHGPCVGEAVHHWNVDEVFEVVIGMSLGCISVIKSLIEPSHCGFDSKSCSKWEIICRGIEVRAIYGVSAYVYRGISFIRYAARKPARLVPMSLS